MPDDSARIPRRHDVWGNIFDNNTACADRAIVANSDSWTNNTATANPNIIANINFSGEFSARKSNFRVCGVKSGVNLYVGPTQQILANVNSIAVENHAAKIHIQSVSSINITAVVAVERWLDFNFWANCTEQFCENF